MKKIEIVSVVKVTLSDENEAEQKAKISQLKKVANQFQAKCLYTEEITNETVVFFASDNPETLSIILGN